MNWEPFSLAGYISIALWLSVLLLWGIHFVIMRQRGWLVHLALILGVAAFVLAKVNSVYYVGRIQVDHGAEIEAQLTKQELARKAATEARESEVAQIRFAEDSGDDFLDIAGMDESDRKYLESFDSQAEPEWKQEKKQRTAEVDESLEAQIGSIEEQQGVESSAELEEDSIEPILMTEKDKLAADRLDTANLNIIRILVVLGCVLIVVDYLGRANRYDSAYFPLPVPSRWVDAMTPREPIVTRPDSPRRSIQDELKYFVRRGESFLYITDDTKAARMAGTTFHRLPLGLRSIETVFVEEYQEKMGDEFIFESLWYGRNSFVLASSVRGVEMLEHFLDLLEDRKETRAHVKQTVRIVWDSSFPIPDETMRRFASLGRATGYSLILCRSQGKRG